MRKKIIPLLLVAVIAFSGGCVKDDLDNLQEQIDLLNTKLTALEQSQQQALLAEIAKLQTSIEGLQSSNTEIKGNYQTLLNNLDLLQAEVTNNSAAVYFGNILTDADFSALKAKGSTIVTGKVVVTSQANIDALANVKMIGGDLVIKGGTTINLTTLANIGGSLLVTNLATEGAGITLPALTSIGNKLMLKDNAALVSLTADALVLIYDELYLEKNYSLTTLSLAGLDFVNSISISAYNESNIDGNGLGVLNSVNLSATKVSENVEITYLNGGKINLGSIGGDFKCAYTNVTELKINSANIGGDFILQYNGKLETVDVSSITKIKGDVNISYNDNNWSTWESTGLSSMPAFAALESIGGDVTVESNTGMNVIESFNNVTAFTGSNITFRSNGSMQLSLLNVFNKLETAGASQWTAANITIFENIAWVSSFAKLLKANNVSITVYRTYDTNTWEPGAILKVDGFDAITDLNSLTLYAREVTSFSAFTALNNFKSSSIYLDLEMPTDMNVGMCSMSNILNKIKNGQFDVAWNLNRKAVFTFEYNVMDRTAAIDQLLAPCGK